MQVCSLAFYFSVGVVFLNSATAIATNVCGNITEDTTWELSGSPYVLTCNITIRAGATLMIAEGVVVQTSSVNRNLLVGTTTSPGSVVANGVTFQQIGTHSSHIEVQRQGSGSFTNCIFEDGVLILGSDLGAVDSCNFRDEASLDLRFRLPVTNCLFENPNAPIKCLPDFASMLASCTFLGTDARIQLYGGNASVNDEWVVMGGVRYYELTGDIRVRDGAVVSIGEGVVVQTNSVNRNLQVGTTTSPGSVVANGVTFQRIGQPSSSHIEIQNQGSGSFTNCKFEDGVLVFSGVSSGSLECCIMAGLEISSGASLSMDWLDFSDASVIAVGSTGTEITMKYHYWGTLDPLLIEQKITHCEDDPDRPCVDFSLPLEQVPEDCWPLGDMNCDTQVSLGDLGEFVQLLLDPAQFQGCYPHLADLNLDGFENGADIPIFVDLLLGQ